MKIITVIPMAKGILKETLTYFTATDVPIGSIISVPVRKKTIDALVIKSENLASAKSMLKSSAFSLKKIDKIKGVSILPEDFLRAVFKIRNYAGTNSGSALASVLPKIYLENYGKLELPVPSSTEKNNLKQEKLILQNSLSERLSYYKTFIREAFARKKSVFITLPTIHDANFFQKNLSKGIENYTFIFHNEIPKKEFIARYNALGSENHPVLIIATPPYLFLLNNKFGAVIVEHESSSAYKMFMRPYLDMRTWAEILTAQYNIKIILADTILRVETLWRAKNYELAEVMPISFRLGGAVKRELVDMKKKDLPPVLSKVEGFAVLSNVLLGKIKESIKSGERSFLFSHRKGLASITVCNDCQTPVLCEFCGKPLALYESQVKQRIFMCHHCKHKKDALVTCNTCQSWNLKALGIGTDLIYEELKKDFPKAAVFRIDKENAKTPKEAKKVMGEFYKTPGAILVGTEMALYYLEGKIENTAVVSFDSLFAIPDFKINEKIIRLLIELERYTSGSLTIQTRNGDEEVLTQFLSGNLSEFAREEMKSREEFNYPPFFTLIKITYKGPKANLEKVAAYLENLLAGYDPAVFRAFTPKIKNDYILNTVIKIKREKWSDPALVENASLDPKLLEKLRSLPPTLSVQIDPDNLL